MNIFKSKSHNTSLSSTPSPENSKKHQQIQLLHPVNDFGIKTIIELEKRIMDNKFDYETI